MRKSTFIELPDLLSMLTEEDNDERAKEILDVLLEGFPHEEQKYFLQALQRSITKKLAEPKKIKAL